MILNEDLLKMASEFDLGYQPLVRGKPFWWRENNYSDAENYKVYIKRTSSNRWGIFIYGNSCVNKQGEVEYQGMPSNRDDDFFNRCRFDDLQKAIAYYMQWKQEIEDHAVKTDKTLINYDDVPHKPYQE